MNIYNHSFFVMNHYGNMYKFLIWTIVFGVWGIQLKVYNHYLKAHDGKVRLRAFEKIKPYYVCRFKERNACACIYHVEMAKFWNKFNNMQDGTNGVHGKHCSCTCDICVGSIPSVCMACVVFFKGWLTCGHQFCAQQNLMPYSMIWNAWKGNVVFVELMCSWPTLLKKILGMKNWWVGNVMKKLCMGKQG